VAEFSFKGQRVIVIGNHFNSKLGDIGLWGAQQPPIFSSNVRRSRIATEINLFVEQIHQRAPKANVLVLGDFNAFFTEQPMKILEGRVLKNLINYNNLIHEDDRYTTNHNGNSQALDYIFANLSLLEKQPEAEIIHINSDYMGKFSDHDPVVARFLFK